MVVRMHFDGKVFVPDEPVDVPVDQPLEAELRMPEAKLSPAEIESRRAAIRRLAAKAIHGLNMSDFAFSRESIYWPPRGL